MKSSAGETRASYSAEIAKKIVSKLKPCQAELGDRNTSEMCQSLISPNRKHTYLDLGAQSPTMKWGSVAIRDFSSVAFSCYEGVFRSSFL